MGAFRSAFQPEHLRQRRCSRALRQVAPHLLLVGALASVSLSPTAHAQTSTQGGDAGVEPNAVVDAGEPTQPSLPGKEAFTTVVRSSPAARSASEVTVDRATIEAAPHRSADELLLLVPGMFVAQHGGEGSAFQMFYRGFDAVHGQDVEISAGGAPVNDVSNLHGQGYADLHFLPPEVVRSVTAKPGTYDPRQGDFAVAGSLRFDLGYGEPGASIKIEGGSFSTYRLFAAFHPSDAPEETFVAAELYQTNGFGPSRATQRASAIGQGLWSLGSGTSMRVMASGFTTRYATAGVLLRSDIESGAVDRFATYDPTQGGSASRAQFVAELRREGAANAGALAVYVVSRSMLLRENFTGYLTSPDGDAQQQVNNDIVLGFAGHYGMRAPVFSSGDKIELGVTGRTDIIEQSQREIASVDNHVISTPVDASVRGYDVGAYVDLSLRPLSVLTLRGGLRADGLGYFTQDRGASASGQARSSQGLHLGPKATVELHPLPWLDVLLSYGKGFRSPQARSLQEGQTTPFTTVHSVEAGVRGNTEKLKGSLAAFYTRLSDDLVFDQRTVRNERVPATQRLGVVTEAVARPWSWLLASTSVTYSRSSFTEGDGTYDAGALVPYAPQWVARLDTAASSELGVLRTHPVKGTLGAGASALLSRPLPFGQFGSNIFLLDARAAARWWHFELGVECWNLVGSPWYEGNFVYASRWTPGGAASLVPVEHVTVGAPRTVRFTLALFI